MEALFRFVLVRPAVELDPEAPSIKITQRTPLQGELEKASKAEDPRNAFGRAAQKFVESDEFIGQGDGAIASFGTALDALENDPDFKREKVLDTIKTAFASDFAKASDRKLLFNARKRLCDSIICIKILPKEHKRPIHTLVGQLRDIDFLTRVIEDKTFPDNPEQMKRYRRRPVQLPKAFRLRSALSTIKTSDNRRSKLEEEERRRRTELDELIKKHAILMRAVKEISSMSGDHFHSTQQLNQEGFALPEKFSYAAAFDRELKVIEHLSDLSLKQLGNDDRDSGKPAAGLLPEPSRTASAASLTDRILAQDIAVMDGNVPFRPMALSEVSFRLNASAAAALSDSTKGVLNDLKLGLTDQPLPRLVGRLQMELDASSKKIGGIAGQSVHRSVKRIGNALVMISTPIESTWAGPIFGGSSSDLTVTPAPTPIEFETPVTHGNVAPSGIADLLIVRQQLTGYEAVDIAHIENVLKGERKQREHSRRREVEEITFRETEVTSSEERELESTNRYEMTRETSETIKEDASVKAGLSVSGKYGPVVEFAASAEGSFSRSKEAANKSAASFSQDVTQRSANKITERMLERSSLRVTNEVVEKNLHELTAEENISGVYQWVTKVYEAQMYNYGLRSMFDFMVPEPAAFLMEILASGYANLVEVHKPPPFTPKPDEIDESNYGIWVQAYGATDVTPPPEIYKTKSFDFKAGGGDAKTNYEHSGQIAIDEGYEAIQGVIARVANRLDKSATLDVVLGRKANCFSSDGDWVWVTPLDNERDSVPFALASWRNSSIAVAGEILCERTDWAEKKWRLETHAKLTTAYKARLSEYEEKLAEYELQAGIGSTISGKNPALNLEIMKDELKKNCISILTEQHYDLFDAIDYSHGDNFPEIDVSSAEAEGAYVRFFEQAFEWENMTWVTYPYFWGRKSKWRERLSFDDPDPLFTQFLKAGYCRVSVPARPGFEGAIDHFMTFGQVWYGGPLPPISSALYLPIADEIAERLGRPGDEVPQGRSWPVRIPTTLVRLRDDSSLPKWVKDAAGNWVEG
jgi:hypothetical protein